MISTEDYLGKRERLLTSVRAGARRGPLALDKASSNLFRHREQQQVQRLDLRDFNHVVRIDEKERIAEVEGLTTYDELVRETLPFNLMPAVVPQLKSITIGGAIAGIGIESSSFKYGFVHETVEGLDILLPDGTAVLATRDNEHRDLFRGFPNSYGTLGYALKATIQLVPVKHFVRLQHQRYTNFEEYFRSMDKICREKTVDFVDGTMFDEGELYITTGEFVDGAEWLSDYTYLKIYYQSIRRKTTDYLSVHDYLWRWDTDWFWCSKHFLLQYPLMRMLWGKKRLGSATYWKIWNRVHRSRLARTIVEAIQGTQEAVIQDVEIPIDHAARFARFFLDKVGIKPVWICPVGSRDPSMSYTLYPMNSHSSYVNFGFWDVVKTVHEEGYFNRAIETKVKELEGHKSLYSSSYYSREEFGQLYNEREYRRLKIRYDPAGALKELYEKCVLRQ